MTSVMASALLALSQLLMSGVRMPGNLLWVSIGLFVASGLVEGAITVAALRAIGRLNPNWVRDPRRAESRAWTVLAVASLVLVVVGVLVASQAPDGIQQLALKLGMQGVPTWVHAPFTDYAVPGLQSAWQRRAGAGLAGMILIFAACALTGRLFARQRSA
jgi:ABC-type Co2+ transport system permease subunit